MGLFSGILGLPLAPLRGTVWVAEQVRQQAEDEFYDPARIRAQLEDVELARRAGELDDDQATEIEDELVERLLVGRARPGSQEG